MVGPDNDVTKMKLQDPLGLNLYMVKLVMGIRNRIYICRSWPGGDPRLVGRTEENISSMWNVEYWSRCSCQTILMLLAYYKILINNHKCWFYIVLTPCRKTLACRMIEIPFVASDVSTQIIRRACGFVDTLSRLYIQKRATLKSKCTYAKLHMLTLH